MPRWVRQNAPLFRPLRSVLILNLVLLTAGLLTVLDLAHGQTAPQQPAQDIYYKTEGVPVGPPAPSSVATVYPRYGSLDNRVLVWFVTQQHTYFGGFVLALPIFCVIMEFAGLTMRNRASALRYDQLARDVLQVALLALSLTAVVGSVMLGLFIWFYPSFMSYMGGTFKTMMPVYAFVFLAESIFLVVYYYSWSHMATPALKWLHAAIGIMANGLGAVLPLLANAWVAFRMSPACVDAQGRELGTVWYLP